MNKQDIYSLISNVFGIDPEDISPDSDFYEDFNVEPTDMVELQLQLEDLLKTKIEEDRFSKIQTIGDLFDLVEEYGNEYLD